MISARRAREGGAIDNHGAPIVRNARFSNHQADINGGAIVNASLVTGTTTIINSTFAGNRAGASGELTGCVFNLAGGLIVVNSTFAGNGLALHTVEPTIDRSLYATTTLINTIVASGGCAGVIVDGGHNLDKGSSCGFAEAALSRSNIDAKLGPLGDYGGDTLTLLPAADSPALGMANDAL